MHIASRGKVFVRSAAAIALVGIFVAACSPNYMSGTASFSPVTVAGFAADMSLNPIDGGVPVGIEVGMFDRPVTCAQLLSGTYYDARLFGFLLYASAGLPVGQHLINGSLISDPGGIAGISDLHADGGFDTQTNYTGGSVTFTTVSGTQLAGTFTMTGSGSDGGSATLTGGFQTTIMCTGGF